MGWETRKGTNNTYYTRSRRVDGRVVREYLGNGPKAEKAARMSADDRKLRQQQRDLEHELMRTMAKGEQLCEEFYDFVETVLLVWMDDAGYHYRRGEWRKRRVPKEQREPATPQPEQTEVVAADEKHAPINRPAKQPKCRPVPHRPPLDCRLGLVRSGSGNRVCGKVGRNQRSAVPAWRQGFQRPNAELSGHSKPERCCAGFGLRSRRRRNRARAPPWAARRG